MTATITRRAALIGAGAVLAWAKSPARALVQAGAGVALRPEVEALVGRMTLEEKAGQLQLNSAAWSGGTATSFNPPSETRGFDGQLADAVAGKLTGVFNGAGAAMAERMQRAVMRESRMKVPLIFAADVIHGYRTIFPIPAAEAASWEPELARRTARTAAFEASGAGLDWTFYPMVDVARDQRWGRAMEGAGEDVLLNRLFSEARVRGFQGDDLAADDAVLACMKHFAGYGAAEAGLDYGPVDVSERTLREVYLPPFRAGLDAGALSVMSAFNELSGIPASGSRWLLTKLLRDEWGFEGFVVSDYESEKELIAHGYAEDERDATRIAITAGVDMSMQSNLYATHLPALVRDGLVEEAVVDRALRRVLGVKQRLGLFDDPFRRIDRRRETARARRPEAIALAREAAVKSVVMLKNEGDLLPLSTGRRIAAIGPFAAGPHDLNGNWVIYGDNAQSVDLATGLRNAGATVTVTPGSGVEEPLAGGIEAAVAAARAADVVVLAIGEHERMAGEAQSRTEIVVPPPQQALAEAVAATGKPVVVLLTTGRALALSGAVADAPAILATWFLGSESGNAVADILFGRTGPSGRLPVSFPRRSGQEPYHYDHKATGRPTDDPDATYRARYRETLNRALYPFGHGLGYGRIAYEGLDLGGGTLAWDGTLDVAATITNRGARAAVEVVQLYIRDRTASVTRPVQQLKAFRKVALAPGASERVAFTLRREDLLFVGEDLTWTVEPGLFDLWIAPSAEVEGVKGQFRLVR